MSDDLIDEIKAINSIYGEGCLASSNNDPSTYVLAPPGASSSFLMTFPSNYPAVSPTINSTNSTGSSGKRGDAARELALLRQALGKVYQPGFVCLFDTIEELGHLLKEDIGNPELVPLPQVSQPKCAEESGKGGMSRTAVDLSAIEEPLWTLSDPVIELKSVFVARCARVSSTAEAEASIRHLLASDRKVRGATHNITAWRIRGPNKTVFQDCNDDGETAAGGRLLHLLQLIDLWDVIVVVTRWYGGHKLGPRRFALINQAARDSFVKASLVVEAHSNDNGQKKKGTK
ncbi:ribosomal protein S5 domain 2-type protein [Poronia punctata]|nr:ribosomal protein S5 domain 2-type protein [Poronia punctata]